MAAIYKREMRMYFLSPVVYVLVGVFMLLTSVFYIRDNIYSQNSNFLGILFIMSIIMLIVLPILTMKTMAEERKNGTEVLLITSSVSVTKIILGKFLAAFSVFMLMTILTVPYVIVLAIFGMPNIAAIVAGYIGYILLCSCYLAVGIFFSCLVDNQIISAVVSILVLFLMLMMKYVSTIFGGFMSGVLEWISILSRYDEFTIGYISIAPVVYYLSFITLFLFFSIRTIENRRMR